MLILDLYDSIRHYPELSVSTRHGEVTVTVSPTELTVKDVKQCFVVNRVIVDLEMTLELNGEEWRPVSWTAVKRNADWRHNSISSSARNKVRYDVPEDINKWIAENADLFKAAQATAEAVEVHNRCIHILIELNRKEEKPMSLMTRSGDFGWSI